MRGTMKQTIQPDNHKLLIKSEEDEYTKYNKVALSAHSSLLNFIALLNTGGVALLLAWHPSHNLNNKYHILILFSFSIYLILMVKFLFFIQMSLIACNRHENIKNLKNNNILNEEELNKIKRQQRQHWLEVILDICGIGSLFAFLTGASMWYFSYINHPSIAYSYFSSFILTLIPACSLFYLFTRWNNESK